MPKNAIISAYVHMLNEAYISFISFRIEVIGSVAVGVGSGEGSEVKAGSRDEGIGVVGSVPVRTGSRVGSEDRAGSRDEGIEVVGSVAGSEGEALSGSRPVVSVSGRKRTQQRLH